MSAFPGVEPTPEVCRAISELVEDTTPASRRPNTATPTRAELIGSALALAALYALAWIANT